MSSNESTVSSHIDLAARRARCVIRPIPDLPIGEKASYTISGKPWSDGPITYRVTGSPEGFCDTEAQEAIAKAFNLWHEVMETLIFTPIQDSNIPVDIEIGFYQWEPHHPEDSYLFKEREPDGTRILAHAFLPIPDSKELKGDIHFSLHIDWKRREDNDFNAEEDYDLITVAAHEIGHALGLDHIPDITSIMYENYSGLYEKIDEVAQQELDALYNGRKQIIVEYLLVPDGGGSGSKRAIGNLFESFVMPNI